MRTPRQGIADGIDMISRHYSNFAPTNEGQLRGMADDYEAALDWCDGDTILAGFRVALQSAGKFAPRFGEIVQCVKAAERQRTGGTIGAPAVRDETICVACGTEALIELGHRRDAEAPRRLYPLHAADCRVGYPEVAA